MAEALQQKRTLEQQPSFSLSLTVTYNMTILLGCNCSQESWSPGEIT